MSSYVDVSIINSVLAGLLLVVAGVWAWYAFNRLQQLWLLDAAAAALDRAEARGLTLRPLGYRARLIAGGAGVVVEWRTGVLGPRSLVRGTAGVRRLEFVRDAGALDSAMDAAAAAQPPAGPDPTASGGGQS